MSNLNSPIQYIDAIEEWRYLTDTEFVLRKPFTVQQNQINHAEAMELRRCTKVKWSQLGDKTTRYLLTIATHRHPKNEIQFLK
jgi:hypothetical protein